MLAQGAAAAAVADRAWLDAMLAFEAALARAQAYDFDVVLRGPGATPFEEAH